MGPGYAENFCRKHSAAIMLAIVLLHVANTIPGASKPFVFDEINTLHMIDAISKTGFPSYYRDEFNPNYVDLRISSIAYAAYAADFLVFGISELSARALSVLFSIGTLLLTYKTARIIFKGTKQETFSALLAAFLYSINPFVSQNALLLDLDGGALAFFTLLFAYAYLSFGPSKNRILLAILFALAVGTKIPTPMVAMLALLAYLAVTGQRKRFFGTLAVGITGFSFFLAALYLYVNATGFPGALSMPFEHSFNIFGIKAQASSLFDPNYPLRVMASLRSLILYVTPPLALLALISLADVLVTALKNKDWESPMNLLLAWGGSTIALYAFLGASSGLFPKYFGPALPAVSILCANYLAKTTAKAGNWRTALAVLAVIIFSAAAIRTPHMEIFRQPHLLMNLVYPLLYTVPILLAYVLISDLKGTFLQKLAISCFFAAIGLSLYFNLVFNTSGFSANFIYGTHGQREVASFFNANTNGSEFVLAPQEVGYYLKRPFYELIIGSPLIRDAGVEDLVKSGGVKYLTIYPYFLDEPSKRKILENYSEDRTIGSFVIYKRAAPSN